MVLGWRRAFCTSIPRDRDPPATKEKLYTTTTTTTNPSPKISSKLGGLFSNPSTPRLQTPPVSSPSLRCRTTTTTTTTKATPTTTPTASAPQSPKLQCKTTRFFNRLSNPSSPRSPSTFSLLKSTLRLSKNGCGICLERVKTGEGMAIFTAECSHVFHFPCIASHIKKQKQKQMQMECPVCGSIWKELPLLTTMHTHKSSSSSPSLVDQKKRDISSPILINESERKQQQQQQQQQQQLRPDFKVYNDDEPLLSPTSVARFNPIPESDENGDEDSDIGVEEFQGFFVNGGTTTTTPLIETNSTKSSVGVCLLPEAAVVSVGRNHQTYAIILKLKSPPPPPKVSHRTPIDLVTLLDVSSGKILMMKRAMRLLVSSLSSSDRLSIVAFSSTSKRLLPLRRMTTNGRRSARRIIDALALLHATSNAADALKKAAKVLEDRREKNPACTILFLSDKHYHNHWRQHSSYSFVSSTRHHDIPVHSVEFNKVPTESAFVKSVGDLLSVVIQDLKLQLGFAAGSAPAEIAAVYSHAFRAASLGSGSAKVGDLYAEEERELLIELKVPSYAIGAHHVLSIRCSYRDPSSGEVVQDKEQALLVPRPHAVGSSAPTIQRLRNLFLTTRALAESRRLVDRNDLAGAHHMLSSTRALLLQSRSASCAEFVNGLEAQLTELQRKRQSQNQRSASTTIIGGREIAILDEKGEPLTPTSAWRAAERLAKVAIMRKSLNRVSDLHGFEDARF